MSDDTTRGFTSGNPSGGRFLFSIAVVIVLAGLLGLVLGASTGGAL